MINVQLAVKDMIHHYEIIGMVGMPGLYTKELYNEFAIYFPENPLSADKSIAHAAGVQLLNKNKKCIVFIRSDEVGLASQALVNFTELYSVPLLIILDNPSLNEGEQYTILEGASNKILTDSMMSTLGTYISLRHSDTEDSIYLNDDSDSSFIYSVDDYEVFSSSQNNSTKLPRPIYNISHDTLDEYVSDDKSIYIISGTSNCSEYYKLKGIKNAIYIPKYMEGVIEGLKSSLKGYDVAYIDASNVYLSDDEFNKLTKDTVVYNAPEDVSENLCNYIKSLD